MSRLARAALGLIAGYAGGVVIGALLVGALSGNAHDKSLETVMTAAFVTGPIGAVLGCIVGMLTRRR